MKAKQKKLAASKKKKKGGTKAAGPRKGKKQLKPKATTTKTRSLLAKQKPVKKPRPVVRPA